MRILLLGEYSNVHAGLAEGLRQLGHEVTVASNGDFWKNYPRDIDFARKPGTLGGMRLMARLYTLLPRFKGYDIVQIINPMFVELKAERIFPILRYLLRHNKKLILCAMGMDSYWVKSCVEKKILRYSDFNIGDKLRTNEEALRERADWIGTPKEALNLFAAEQSDGIVTGLYEYWACYHPHFPKKTTYIPLPIHVGEPPIISDSVQLPLHGFIGISKKRHAYKGTDIMLRAAEDVAHTYPERLKLHVANGIPFKQYQELMNGCDFILDQLYSYTPAMNALLAMGKGIICVGGGEPENYDIINEKTLRPIINVLPTYDSVYKAIEGLVLHPERIPELKRQSIAYVRNHHDYIHVAQQYETFYKRALTGKTEQNQ